MAIKDLQKLLTQVHEPDEYRMVPHNLDHPLYYIWKVENASLKDLDLLLRPFRKEHSRFDIFINGQYILEKDYIFEQDGKDFHIKFKKSNFPFVLESSDDIKLEGDLQVR